jgi:hypothetical protein
MGKLCFHHADMTLLFFQMFPAAAFPPTLPAG